MYCTNCGSKIDDQAVFCPYCGTRVGASAQAQGPYVPPPYGAPPRQFPGPAPDDAPNGGFLALSLFFPLVGLILYLVWMNQYPQRAKSCGKGAIIGVCLSFGLAIFYVIFVFLILGLALSTVPYSGVLLLSALF